MNKLVSKEAAVANKRRGYQRSNGAAAGELAARLLTAPASVQTVTVLC